MPAETRAAAALRLSCFGAGKNHRQMTQHARWIRWVAVLGRSLLVGAATGLLGGALLFFVFGFVGFTGASIPTRIENGYEAALDPGLRKGIIAGVGMAAGLTFTAGTWRILGGPFQPARARPWLSALAAVIVVFSNFESLRDFRGWDDVGIATVFGIAVLVATTVWFVTPWALKGRSRGR